MIQRVQKNKLLFSLLFLIFLLSALPEISAQPRIAVLYSNLTDNVNDKSIPKVIDVISAWEYFLMNNNINYSVIYDNDLESGIVEDFDLLILPSVKFVNNDQVRSISKFLNAGKSIISIGSDLINIEDKKSDYYSNIKSFFNISAIKILSTERISFYQFLSNDPMFTNPAINGGEIQVTCKHFPLVTYLNNQDCKTVGYADIQSNGNQNFSSVVIGKNKGWFLWSGFDLIDIVGGKNDLKNFNNIILNFINLIDDKPDIWFEFPFGENKSAMLVTLESSPKLLPETVDRIKEEGIEPYLIISPEQIVQPNILKRFNTNNIILDISTLTNSGFSYDKLESQFNRLNKDYNVKIENLLIDKLLLNLLFETDLTQIGIKNIVIRSTSPFLPFIKNNILITTISENIPIEVNYTIKEINYGELVSCSNNYDDDFIHKIKSNKFFRTNLNSFETLRQWCELKESLKVELVSYKNNSAEIIVTNSCNNDIKDVLINYNSPENINADKLIITSTNKKIIDYFLDQKTGLLILQIDNVNANSKVDIKIQLEN